MFPFRFASVAALAAVAVSAQLAPQPSGTAGTCRAPSSVSKLPPPKYKPAASTEPGSARRDSREHPRASYALVDSRTTNLQPTGCSPVPVNRTVFSPNDGAAYNWISVTGIAVGDTVQWSFYAPDGSSYATSNYTATFSGNGCFWAGIFIQGYTAASLPGDWTIKISYNGQPLASATFTIASGTGATVCRYELSLFFGAANALGIALIQPQDPSGYPQDIIVTELQAGIAAAKTAFEVIPCIPFDYSEFDSVVAAVPSLDADGATNAVSKLIQDYQAAVLQAGLSCDLKEDLTQLYVAGVNLGAAAARASLTVCSPIPPAAQADINAHMAAASAAMSVYAGCATGVGPIPTTIAFNPARPYDAYTTVSGWYWQVLWHIGLSDCCCVCNR